VAVAVAGGEPVPVGLGVGVLVGVAVFVGVALGVREVLEVSRRVLTPHAGGLVVSGQLSGVFGAYDGILGEVCLALGDVDAARRHLTAALELLERTGNVQWTARARTALDACS
jgi:hypothetical protein